MPDEEPTEAELRSLDLYDPEAADASYRLELLRYLISVGATVDDLLEYREELPALGTVLLAMPGRPSLSGPEVSERTGVSDEFLSRLWRAAGFPAPEGVDPMFSEAEAGVVGLIAAARDLFGEEAVLQLARVIGSSLARIADAVVSAFLVNIEVPIAEDDPAGLAVARANVAATSLLPGLSQAMDVLLRRHILAARRSLRSLQEAGAAGIEVQHLAVGFVDLVGSTALAQQLPVAELGRALSEFESSAADAVTARRGRVVKLIGDEVMFVAPDAIAGCDIGLDLAEQFASHAVLPPVRVGLAAGDVITRDGDYFGPIVNVAARAVKEAEPGTVAVTEAVAKAVAGTHATQPLGTRPLKGLGEDVVLYVVRRRD